MPDQYSVHGQVLISNEELGLPRRTDRRADAGDGNPLRCAVVRDDTVVEQAQADRNLEAAAQPSDDTEGVTETGDGDGESDADSEILEPDGWWGVRTPGDASARAGITYSGYLFEVLLDDAAVRSAKPEWAESSLDAVVRYAPDPEVSFIFPLGNCLERLIVPLWLMLAYDNVASVHAGAVIDREERVGWMWTGPSGAGKSSIVAEIIQQASLRPAADETAVLQVVEQNGAVTMFPGAPWLRLYEPPGRPRLEDRQPEPGDSWSPDASGELPDPIDKRWYRYRDEVYPQRPVPLQTWFLLRPNEDVDKPLVERVAGSEAATSLLNETIDFNQRDDGWARRRFKNAMAVARRVPGLAVRYNNQRQSAAEIAEVLAAEMNFKW